MSDRHQPQVSGDTCLASGPPTRSANGYAGGMGIPLSEWSGSGAPERLRETLVQFNETTAKQTAQLIRLTWALVILTVFLFLGLLVQVGLALAK